MGYGLAVGWVPALGDCNWVLYRAPKVPLEQRVGLACDSVDVKDRNTEIIIQLNNNSCLAGEVQQSNYIIVTHES